MSDNNNDEKTHRSFRRVRRSDMRTLTIEGYNEEKYGAASKMNKYSREATRNFTNKKKPVLSAPIISTDIPSSFKAELNSNFINYRIAYDVGIPVAQIRVDNKYKAAMKKIGTVVEKEGENSFQITAYDLLYGLQAGVLGVSKTARQSVFKQMMDINRKQDENYMQKYLVFLELKNKNYLVMDGMAYGTTFAIVEPMPNSIKTELKKISKKNPEHVGSSSRSKFSVIAAGLVDVVTDDMGVDEVIKGQHLTSKADMRYFLASVDDPEYVDDVLVDGEVSLYLMRKDRLKKEFRSDADRDTLLISDLEPFEVR